MIPIDPVVVKPHHATPVGQQYSVTVGGSKPNTPVAFYVTPMGRNATKGPKQSIEKPVQQHVTETAPLQQEIINDAPVGSVPVAQRRLEMPKNGNVDKPWVEPKKNEPPKEQPAVKKGAHRGKTQQIWKNKGEQIVVPTHEEHGQSVVDADGENPDQAGEG
ncbi:hypothetical protein K7X08_002523 [Anisodus acutangulus]|uniref:Uncharacterized protein n=1 Tax=Anisodus acutangulus TaxID=402998 RepID=A0A9Q1LT27_9SOLA|nr:hypothetical protein K7X08_002523 [Anisodus acutangulus]